MKKKTFECGLCGYSSKTPQGISAHVRFNHKDALVMREIDNKGRLLDKPAGDILPEYTTTIQVTPPMKEEVAHNCSTNEPPHYAIFKDFEEAVRADEMKGSTDYPEAIEEDYNRARRLLGLRILLLQQRAAVADMLERELLS